MTSKITTTDLDDEHETGHEASLQTGDDCTTYSVTIREWTAHGQQFSIEQIPENGSCLFHCFERAFNFYHSTYGYRDLLPDIAQMLHILPSYLNTETFEEYVTNIQNPLYWGGEIEIGLLAYYHRVNVVVFDLRIGDFLPHPPDAILFGGSSKSVSCKTDRMFLVYNGTHYEIISSTNTAGEQKYLFPPEDNIVEAQIKMHYCSLQASTPLRADCSAKNNRSHILSKEKDVQKELADEVSQLNEQFLKMAVRNEQEPSPLISNTEKSYVKKLKFPIHLVSKLPPTESNEITCTTFAATVKHFVELENTTNKHKNLIVYCKEAMSDLFLSVQKAIGWPYSTSLLEFDQNYLNLIRVTKYPTEKIPLYLRRFLVLAVAWARRLIEVRLEEDNYETIRRKLATSYIYHSYRHRTNDQVLFQYYLKVFNITTQLVEEYENEEHTYYGSYLSDDSDDEMNKSQIKVYPVSNFENYVIQTLEPKLFYQRGTQKGSVKLDLGATPSVLCPMYMRIAIYPNLKMKNTRKRFSNATRQSYEQELAVINTRIANGQSIDSESLIKNGVKTQFYVAQYRGIQYSTAMWSARERRRHRKLSELSEPIYSMSIIRTDNREESTLTLREIFLAFQEPAPWLYQNYTFSSFADLVQQAYTNDYVKFHHIIDSNVSFIADLLLNSANPFVSTGDIPYHALKYAYGIKAYSGLESIVLKPRWNKKRKAERPYSGKVYVSLHPISDYTLSDAAEQPLQNHLTSLNYSGRVQIPIVIAPERETSFVASIPKERLVYQHIARYPSFEHRWHCNFFAKYGLTERFYEQLSTLLDQHPPHSDERKKVELLLAEWLCCYHGLRLVELARQRAEDKLGGILIYRDVQGNFVLEPPRETKPSNDPQAAEQVATARRKRKNTCKGGPISVELSSEKSEQLNIHPRYKFNPQQTDSRRNVFWMLLRAVELDLYRALQHFLSFTWIRKMINYRYKCMNEADENQGMPSNLDNIHIIHSCVHNEHWQSLSLILSAFRKHEKDLEYGTALMCEVISRDNKKLKLRNLSWLHFAVLRLASNSASNRWSEAVKSTLENKHMCQSADEGATVISEDSNEEWENVSPLHLIVLLQANIKALQIYLSVRPSDIHRKDNKEQTPLHYVERLHNKVCNVLRQYDSTYTLSTSDTISTISDSTYTDGSGKGACDKCGLDIDTPNVLPKNKCDCGLTFCIRCKEKCDDCDQCVCDFCTECCTFCPRRFAKTCLILCDEKSCDSKICLNCSELCSKCNRTMCNACFSMHICALE